MIIWSFKSCAKCHGDRVLDGDEWRCWQCGTYYYPNTAELIPDPEPFPDQSSDDGSQKRRKPGPSAFHGISNDQGFIETRWWTRNQEVVTDLDAGLPLSEVATRAGKGIRRIRGIQEALTDYRLG